MHARGIASGLFDKNKDNFVFRLPNAKIRHFIERLVCASAATLLYFFEIWLQVLLAFSIYDFLKSFCSQISQ